MAASGVSIGLALDGSLKCTPGSSRLLSSRYIGFLNEEARQDPVCEFQCEPADAP
jgi:hypothetical protein